jgi:GNAT superfamily N-acetyltransferase
MHFLLLRVKKTYQIICFLFINIIYITRLRNIIETRTKEISISGTRRSQLSNVYEIYSFFNNHKQLGIEKRILFFFLSKKCIFIAKEIATNQIVGVEIYYKNNRDVIENTMHQGFRGVLPEWQGKKIGTMITNHAINHYKDNGLDGLSSRVSLNNLPSLTSNFNLGFRPIEKYFDRNMQEERYYLICPFNNKYWNFMEAYDDK